MSTNPTIEDGFELMARHGSPGRLISLSKSNAEPMFSGLKSANEGI